MTRNPSFEDLERKIALFETGSDAMVLAEVGTGRILDANEICTAIYGYHRDELLKMTVMDLSSEPEEARKAVERRAQRIPLRYHRKKDGSLFPVDIIVNDLQLQGREVRIAAIRDITGQKQVEEVLRESEERARRSAEVNRTMAELGRIITSSLHIDGIYEQFAGAVRRVVPFDRLTIGIINAEQNTFFYQHTIGLDLPGRKKGDCVPLPPIVAEAVHKRASVLVHADDQGFARGYPMLPVLFKIGIRSAISAPIFSKDEVIGALLFFSRAPHAYTEDHLRLAEGMARQISGTIANSLLLAERQRSEERLRESEEKHRVLVENAGEAILVAQEGMLVFVNPKALEVSGYTCEELTSLPFPDVIHPDDRQMVLDRYTKRMQGVEAPSNYIFRIMRKSGETRWVRLNVVRIDWKGNPATLNFLTDITEKKLFEEKAREVADRILRQKEILFSLATSPAVTEGNVERAAREMNEEVSTLFGIGRVSVWLFNEKETELECVDLYERASGRHSSGPVLKERQYRSEFEALKSANYVDASDALTDPRTAGYVEGYLKPLRITSMLDGVIRVRKKNIGTVCLEHVEVPHQWEQDEIAFVCQLADQIGMAHMNRERQRAEEALRESEQALRRSENEKTLILNSTSEMIAFYDLDLRVLWANRVWAKSIGKKAEELVGYHCYELRHKRKEPCVHCRVIKARDTRQPQEGERKTLDGKYWFQHGYPVLDDRGEMVGLIEIDQDITEQKRSEEEMIKHRDTLEDLVRERTDELEQKSRSLEELNVTLKVLLQQVQEDREKLEHRLVSNVMRLVLPYVEKMKKGHLDERTLSYLRIAESNLNEIMSPFLHKIQQLRLTPRETQVASLIKDGKATKEIGEILGIAPSAVNTLRNRMRSKLHLNKKKINLRSYLQSLE